MKFGKILCFVLDESIPKMFVLIFDPNPIIPFAFEPAPIEFEDDAAAAAAANNKGFDVIVISRPELLLLLDD